LSQAELARAAGCGRVTISQAETGRRTPRYSTLVLLVDALGLHVEDLSER